MKLENIVKERSSGVCELSSETGNLNFYEVLPTSGNEPERIILICDKALAQIEKREEPDSAYWEKILPSAMWSEVPGVQVVSWRMLNRFRNESWAADALDMMYLDEETLEWAKASGDHIGDGSVLLHKDSNGNILQNGDTVTLIKDLDVKGSSLTAKIGTAVRNIRLVHDNVEQIEGKVEGQSIVILTKFVKK
ncbi:PhnA domain-containing protein [Moheibacter sp.]|uniref:PhnA domain-containing protein n=1 Tax=Moheibacter sp. TaxID=1965316 RepID=UPI003C76ADE4